MNSKRHSAGNTLAKIMREAIMGERAASIQIQKAKELCVQLEQATRGLQALRSGNQLQRLEHT